MANIFTQLSNKTEKGEKKVAKKSTTKTAPRGKTQSTEPQMSTAKQALLLKIQRNLEGAQRFAASRGGNYSYYKLSGGDRHALRLVLPPEGPFTLAYKQQRGKKAGNFATAIDLGWLTSPEAQGEYNIIDEMLKRFAITQDDLDLISRYGEPYDRLFKALQVLQQEDMFIKAGIGQKRSLFVIYAQNEFQLLETSSEFSNTVGAWVEEDPEFILEWANARDIIISGSGQGLKRKYIYAMSSKQGKSIKFNPDEQSIPNLYDVVSNKILSYRDKVRFLFNSHRALVDEAQLSMSDFGIEEGE